MIKKLVDDISKEKKTRQDAIRFLNVVERALYQEKRAKDFSENISTFEAIDTARTYLTDRAPSVKMLLEYAALSI